MRRFRYIVFLLCCLMCCLTALQGAAQGIAGGDEVSHDLSYQQHLTTRDYQPWIRWWWNGNKVDTNELKRELHLLKDAGIGGVEINPIEFPAKRCDSLGIPSLTWLSDEWIEALGVALREAKSLGMGCDLLVGSGWPFGKETLPMNERAQAMLLKVFRLNELDTLPNGTRYITRQQIYDAVDPKVTVPNPDRTFELFSLTLTPDSITSLKDAVTLPIPAGDTIVFSNLTYQISILYAVVRCTSFASVIDGAPGASGPILDHMNATAVYNYLETMRIALEAKLGPMKKWLRAYFVDSMELEGSNWTDDFVDAYRRIMGYPEHYDIESHLPFILYETGRLGDPINYECGAKKSPQFEEEIQKVRLDFEYIKAKLLDERYTQTFLSWSKQQGVLSRAQAYGRGFFPLESSYGYDIPEGESWTTNYLRHRVGEEMEDEDYRRGRAYTMINKYVSSAAHQMGRHIVSAEEMTNTYRIFETPLELLKLGSDMSAISGTTHSVWHGFNYSPSEAGFPGWVQYGSYYNEQNTWWPYFHLLNEYRTRMSLLLQNAEMQTDIAIVLPTNKLWKEYGVQTEPFPNYPKGSIYEIPQLLWEAIHKNGGNCDFVSPFWSPNTHKHYQVMMMIEDSCLVVSDYRYSTPRVSRVPYPADKHYLEWYTALQEELHLPHAVTIERPNRFLLQNHYKITSPAPVLSVDDDPSGRWQLDPGDDIYLFVNADIREFHSFGISATFPKEVTRGRQAWLYDCNTGHRKPVRIDNGQCYFSLNEASSCFIIFHKAKSQKPCLPRRTQFVAGERYPLPNPQHWTLTMHHAIEQWDTTVVMDTLQDLRNTPFADFSGTLVYTTTIMLDSSQCGSESHTLRLGTKDVSEVRINGIDCGTIWFGSRDMHIPPHVMHPGENTIEIKLTTTLNNYVHTLTDDPVMQHYVFKRNVPTTPAGLRYVTIW